jgi:hypothetical protein
MKQALLIIAFLMLAKILFAPGYTTLYIEKAKAIDPYKKIIYAIGKVETNLDTLKINWNEYAFGYFQIRQVRLNDYYKRTGIRYTLWEMRDYHKAEKVFLYYANEIGPNDMETIARKWNGSGPKTKDYWKKVKTYLYENKSDRLPQMAIRKL